MAIPIAEAIVQTIGRSWLYSSRLSVMKCLACLCGGSYRHGDCNVSSVTRDQAFGDKLRVNVSASLTGGLLPARRGSNSYRAGNRSHQIDRIRLGAQFRICWCSRCTAIPFPVVAPFCRTTLPSITANCACHRSTANNDESVTSAGCKLYCHSRKNSS